MAVQRRHTSSLRLLFWSELASLLVLRLIAMQFTDEVRWSAFDFTAAAFILAGTGVGIEVAVLSLTRPTVRAVAVMGIISCATFIWVDSAVGLF